MNKFYLFWALSFWLTASACVSYSNAAAPVSLDTMDQSSAKEAIDKMAKEGKFLEIAPALLNKSVEVQAHALEKLKSAKVDALVPMLLDYLEKNNVPAEGSENASVRFYIKKLAISALEANSGTKIEVSNVKNIQQVSEVIAQMRKVFSAKN